MSAEHDRQESDLQQRSTGRRYFELDALRGLAAATVVAGHTRLVLHGGPIPWYTAPLFAGGQSVCLFFVLSGFVLALPFLAGKGDPYPRFVVRRVLRIYLPFLAAAALSILGDAIFFHHHPSLSPWFSSTWNVKPTLELVMHQLAIGRIMTFNSAFWSLRYELQLSMLMPLLVWAMRRIPTPAFLALFCLLAFSSTPLIERLDSLDLLGWTIVVSALFVFGAALAQRQTSVKACFARLHPLLGWSVFAGSLVLFYGYPLQAFRLLRYDLPHREYLVSGLGAAGIIACALSLRELSRALRHPFCEYLGRISYSLSWYTASSSSASSTCCMGKCRIGSSTCSWRSDPWALAHLFCILIEEPCIRLSKSMKAVRA